jgi:hypothetical protein
VDIATNPVINLEEYNLIGFGSGVYFWSVGCKLKKWIKNIKWSSKEACKPDAFIFTTQGAKKATRVHGRFNHFLHKKAGITTITGWACQTKQVHSSEALTNLKEWVDSKIHTPSHTKTSSKN